MGYIDPKTDIVVAAGGDGTLFEVCKCYHQVRYFVRMLNRWSMVLCEDTMWLETSLLDFVL